MIQEISKKEFKKEVLESKIPVVVDNYADWCGPCKVLSPILEALSKEMKKVKFVKLNVDQNSELAQEFEVFSIPTLILFKDGEQVDRVIGLRTKDDLEEWINENI